MNSRLATLEINHLPKGGGQFDPPLPRAIRTTALPGLQRWASLSQARIEASIVKEDVTTAADGQKTAAQPAVEPAKPSKPNIALTGGKASHVRKNDLIIARNALDPEKVAQLNRISLMFLGYAEDRASQRQDLRMDDSRQCVDCFVEFNEWPLLKDDSTISHERMQQIAHERYAAFETKRRTAEALAADVEDIKALELLDIAARKEANVPLDDLKLMPGREALGPQSVGGVNLAQPTEITKQLNKEGSSNAS
ncbi:virulence RhuM family protein [Xanthomonas campestris]|uniref:RhuM family protein n=1 Tax=Xanthomonas TaxID=338 RepID=UPI001E3BE0F4|nr:RhuM family protein [Xanthomonas campestris]MCC5044992.1 virulence RhuM family protein [Xanthomonas campestris]MEB1145665.1 RhuM family protein [Xanthomonas campestris pv. campestris]